MNDGIKELRALMQELLSPSGCDWDKKQTHESLRKYMVEETFEVIDAIDAGDDDQIEGELGDLLFQIVFHCALGESREKFDFDSVAKRVTQKMKGRHPWIFADADKPASNEQSWAAIKEKERAGKSQGALSGVPRSLPALVRAQRVGEKAAGLNFDWTSASEAWEKVREEISEIEGATTSEQVAEELGDLLFAITSFARKSNLDAEAVLRQSIQKFEKRFSEMEKRCIASGRKASTLAPADWDRLWDEVKKQ